MASVRFPSGTRGGRICPGALSCESRAPTRVTPAAFPGRAADTSLSLPGRTVPPRSRELCAVTPGRCVWCLRLKLHLRLPWERRPLVSLPRPLRLAGRLPAVHRRPCRLLQVLVSRQAELCPFYLHPGVSKRARARGLTVPHCPPARTPSSCQSRPPAGGGAIVPRVPGHSPSGLWASAAPEGSPGRCPAPETLSRSSGHRTREGDGPCGTSRRAERHLSSPRSSSKNVLG